MNTQRDSNGNISGDDVDVVQRDRILLDTVKQRIFQSLIEHLSLEDVKKLPELQRRAELQRAIERVIDTDSSFLSIKDREEVIVDLLDELLGLGPLEQLLRDQTANDILINNSQTIYVERNGKLEESDVHFRDDKHLLQIIDRIITRIGRRLDDSSPMVDARLADGSRVNAIIPPLALDGPAMSIRRFGKTPITLEKLLSYASLTREMATLLQACIKARLNIIISGGTGSGKTTLLNSFSHFIPPSERIITIEDSAELQLQRKHVVRLETRPANVEGRGQISIRDLVRNALRMRPDRIIIGECRGAEALDMLQAMNTGHEGSMTTLHANSPRDAMGRLEMMIIMGGIELPMKAMRQQINAALDLIVQVERIPGGSRKVTSITEVMGMEGEVIVMQEIFNYAQTGVDANGRAIGHFEATGIRPKFADLLHAAGQDVSNDLFIKRTFRQD